MDTSAQDKFKEMSSKQGSSGFKSFQEKVHEREDSRSESVAGSIAFDQLEKDRVRWQIFDSLASKNDGILTSGALIDLFHINGILEQDPRILSIVKKLKALNGFRKEIELDAETFFHVIHGCTTLMSKLLKGVLVVPDFPDLCNDIDGIYEKVQAVKGGNMADYIPQLAKQDPDLLGISICTIDGQRYSTGCNDYQFCVQSCCKPIAYLIAAQENGFDMVHHHVGREPSGATFNQLTLKAFPSEECPDRKIPHNPMINAGAIMSTALIKRHDAMADRFQHVMTTWERLCSGRVGFMNAVYLSEKDTADRNWCLGYMMQEFSSFPDGTNLRDTLEFYFQQCSIEANIDQMAVLAATLANGGTNPLSGDRIFDPFHVRNCLSLMLSSGMYDYSGEWMFTIGLPAKSGVAGCIWCVIPNKLGIVTFSPPLDDNGNSFRGVHAFKEFIAKFNFHQYDSLKGVINAESEKKDPTQKVNQIINDQIAALLFAAAQGDLNDVIALFTQGCDVWSADYDARSALHLAASENHLNIVKFLIQNAKNICEGQEEVADKLSYRDRWGRTPLDDAISGEHDSVVRALKKVHAKTGAGDSMTFNKVECNSPVARTLTMRKMSMEEREKLSDRERPNSPISVENLKKFNEENEMQQEIETSRPTSPCRIRFESNASTIKQEKTKIKTSPYSTRKNTRFAAQE